MGLVFESSLLFLRFTELGKHASEPSIDCAWAKTETASDAFERPSEANACIDEVRCALIESPQAFVKSIELF